MDRLGRFLALPWLLLALAGHALAPAEAATMRPDMAAAGICSAHDLGGGHRGPAKDRAHDCCAFACALVGLGAAAPQPPDVLRLVFAAPAGRITSAAGRTVHVQTIERPRARGPPALLQTI